MDSVTVVAPTETASLAATMTRAERQRLARRPARLTAMQDKVNSGQGTLGQFLVNPQLNEAIAGTTHEFQELAKGLRANPRKFIALRLF